ncbi:bifunctional lysylphosphatidylglycerol synthetase/lysine--tRNA ligase LysX [Arsenicicoccus sp. oral taxon 190]|uniref:bifunctional lysylphosphatidylglycerol synthetase/lysine--tRNA ligase LysX n=1 Tax=Arsenicicoccus sp. oral taxon 190 TaxID=1658671 RepID=UPI000A5B937E|nr:bifunctional lysylphosphatidylglycerol synthetase/lysine--tRNA ligase LysX [Arsenicicoccus sp. oral taxon 190]
MSRLPKVAGAVVTWGAIWSVLSIFLQRFDWPTWVDEAFGILGVPTGPNLFLAALLLIVGEALRRGLRVAWVIAMLVEAFSVVVYVSGLGFLAAAYGEIATEVSPGDESSLDVYIAISVISAITSAVLLIIFWRKRAAFPAHRPVGSLRESLIILIGGLLAVIALVFALSWVAHGNLSGPSEALWWTIQATLGFSLPLGLQPTAHSASAWLATLAGVLAAAVLLIAIWRFLHSARRADLMSDRDELALRGLLARNGDLDSLSYFATRRDKSVVFAPDGTAAVTYRVVGPVCLASGDPVGPVEAWPKAIRAWLEHTRHHAWHAGVLSASETGARAYVEAGLRARTLGDEAVIDVDQFSLEGRAMRPVKRAVARVRDAGCSVTVSRHADLSADTLAEITRLADEWRGEGPDRGFSMALNRMGDRSDGRNVAVVVRDAEGQIIAVQSFVPWGTRGLSLDLMRRSPSAVNGVNEAMVAALVDAAPDLGVRHVSLNFAMFRSVFSGADKVGAGLGVRVADRILNLASRFWQLESLYEANAKYLPRWEPRFVCFESASVLPQIGLAAGVAEGFLPGRAIHVSRTGEDLVVVDGAEPRPLADLIIDQDRELLTPPSPTRRVSEQQKVRLDKLDVLRDAGMEPYPVGVPRTCSVGQALAQVGRDGASHPVSVTGRVRSVRDLGGVVFCVVEEHGAHIQGVLERDVVEPQLLALWRHTVDVGDHVSLTGPVGRSRNGEPSVLVTSWAMASKCLRPIPDSRTGFTNPEARVRQRYLDLIVNRESTLMLQARSRAVAAIRHGFAQRGYMEVETPMLQAVHGGASARPFRTHINAYDADLYLRIAPELFLKHLCVGGMDRIFELNRNFRNEGADATHNPEFTSVEAYAAHGDYNTMRELTRELIIEVAAAVHGEPVAVRPGADGTVDRIRLDGEWPVVSVHEAVSRASGVELTSASTVEEVRAVADRHGVHHTSAMTSGEIVLELYDELVEGQTTFPTFYTDFPLETSPLTRTHRTDPRLSERWDLVAFGAEIGTAYSELVDPVDQRNRLTEQSYKAAAGDPEAMEIDEGFLTALEYAMPPTGGLGIGVDRLVMMLTGANIRATLAFPFTKPSERG